MSNQTIGVAIITYNERSIKECVESLIDHVDQIVVATQTDTPPEIINILASYVPKVQVHNFGDWIDDFAAKRNFSFAPITADWVLWIDSDDTLVHPEAMRELIANVPDEVGALWFPYHYARDEFNNLSTVYERERLLRRKNNWIWQSRLHETVSPLEPCKFMRTDKVIVLHNHTLGHDRNERNFRILGKMYEENPEEKRIWLYLGHQHFAAHHWMTSSEWYLKFGTDNGAIPLERFQALCYCSKALREMADPQALDVALAAINLCPEYKDGYMEAAHSYLKQGQWDRAIWYANMCDQKDLIKEPPNLIFVNPLEYTFNRYALLAECYLHKKELRTSLEWIKRAYEVRPSQEVVNNHASIEAAIRQEDISRGIKALSLELLNNKELVKMPHVLHATPFWFRETEDYQMLKSGTEYYTKDLKSEPEIIEGKDKSVVINVANAFNLKDILKQADAKYDRVMITCPMPTAESKQINVLSPSDMENLIMTEPGRHLLNLRVEEKRVWAEYDKKSPQNLAVRIFLGQGLEYWSPKTIKDVGCGGSETWAAMVGKELAAKDCQPIIYAMDNQVWDGVIYRNFSKYNPETMSCLFISSRIPEVFNANIPTMQKWLWAHDTSFFERLTPEIAESLDAIVCQTHWHVDHLKKVYPWLANAEVVDMDDCEKTYEDDWAVAYYHGDGQCMKLPKIAIIGNAIDTKRFDSLNEKRIPHRFIWCSSPDRGLEELLVMWPGIKDAFPDAELNIFYGWEYFNSSLGVPAQREFKERIRTLLEQPGVKWCGRVGQEQIALELAKSDAILYPPHPFRETYGIAFLEAQAAGVLCFYRMNGALGETVGKRGIPLPMGMAAKDIVAKVVETLGQKEACDIIRAEAKAYALNRTWGKQVDKILTLYKDIEQGKRL